MRSAPGRLARTSAASASQPHHLHESRGTRRKASSGSSAATLPRHAWSAAGMRDHSRGRKRFGTRLLRTVAVLACCVVVALLWRGIAGKRRVDSGTATSAATAAGDRSRQFARLLEKDDAPALQAAGRQKESPQQVIAQPGGSARLEPVEVVKLNPRPHIRRWSGSRDEKFLAYFPHSVRKD